MERSELEKSRMKFNSFKEFELFIFKEQQVANEEEAIRTYTFRGKAEVIKVSFIGQNQK